MTASFLYPSEELNVADDVLDYLKNDKTWMEDAKCLREIGYKLRIRSNSEAGAAVYVELVDNQEDKWIYRFVVHIVTLFPIHNEITFWSSKFEIVEDKIVFVNEEDEVGIHCLRVLKKEIANWTEAIPLHFEGQKALVYSNNDEEIYIETLSLGKFKFIQKTEQGIKKSGEFLLKNFEIIF